MVRKRCCRASRLAVICGSAYRNGMRDPITINGQIYDLAHLNSFTVTIPPKDSAMEPAKIVVTFSHHVFTKEWDHLIHTIDEKVVEDGDPRAFCSQRYGWSKDLEQIIKYHVAGKAYESRDGKANLNYLFYEDRDGRSPAYAIYFRLTKADKISGVDGVLRIISAYENAKLPAKNKLQSVKFAMHVSRAVGFKKADSE